MEKLWLLIFQIVLIKADYYISLDWQMPYFKSAQTEGVALQNTADIQKITVKEELSWPFILAKINYIGSNPPMLGTFDIGDNSLLGAVIYQNESEWLISIEKRQDYENPQQRIYSFQIYIRDEYEGLVERGILITLENIFDNQPTILYSPTPCKVEELHSNYLTNCTFSIYDPDGMDRNNIRIIVNGANDLASIFDFKPFGVITTYEKQYKLFVKKELHYENRAIYNLDVRVYDAGNNTGFIYAILEVIDLPNRDPVWVKPLTTATFDEKREQYFTVKAIDGDTGINKPICYRLEFVDDYSKLIQINKTTGLLHVLPIDRDALNQQIFSFFTCAYKCDNSSWIIKNTTILIVQDVNDHIPEITLVPENVKILESKYLTIPLDYFFVEDLDLGINATYTVNFMNNSTTLTYTEAFSLIPTSGYQRTNFSLSVIQAESLDYELEDWRQFELMLIAQELENAAHYSNCTLKVELINWNDEWPIFEAQKYEVSVWENVTRDCFLQRVQATDRDVDDMVIHSLVGNIFGITINPQTGVVTTSEDNVFDYERQNLLLLQVQAQDTLITSHANELHSTFTQLIINVLDVNDETPELRLPRSIVNVTENSPALTLITDKIEAHDVDTTARLSFEILWHETYATKSGQEAAKEDYEDCLIIETKFSNNNLAYGFLYVNPSFEKQLDYEKYDTIFLYIKVTDLNQEMNADSVIAVLTLRVDDLNDNAPQFAEGTLEEPFRVNELEEKGTVLGTINAFDVDGVGNNIITFHLRSVGAATADNLVTINNITGVLRVNGKIECDVPKIYYLEYEIILTDGKHETVDKLNVSIVDINNRSPVLGDFEHQVALWENATTGQLVGRILAYDEDRDVPHNVLEYVLNSVNSDVQHLFQINRTTGIVTVNLRNGLTLDRDNGVTYHYIPVLIKDNFNFDKPDFGPVNQVTTFLNVSLLDANDNAPIMPGQEQFSPEFSEADKKGKQSKSDLLAVDRDEPNTPNSQVSYRILSIEPVSNNTLNVSAYAKLFGIVGSNSGRGKLVALKHLKGYYGHWRIQVEAYDHGQPVMRNSSFYDVVVRPYNFHAPEITYPLAHRSLRVCYALQEVNRPLYQADCMTHLSYFEAFDSDGGEFGDVTFQLGSESEDSKYFKLVKKNRNQTSLYLLETVKAGIYTLNLRAIDGGGRTSKELNNLHIVFVDMLENPMFLESTFETNFTENEQGLLEERYIPTAYDPKNEGLSAGEEQYKLFYFIDAAWHTEEEKLFSLDSEARQLKLLKTLDRELVDTHRLHIIVSNNENGLINNPNGVNHTLEVLIRVNDVNDNAPIFQEAFYAAGITIKDTIGKDILMFHAQDPDLNDPTSYEIIQNSITTQGKDIEQQKLEFFKLQRDTGVLSLNSYVTNNMNGFFMFDIIALDTAVPPHQHIASVKIYIVSEANRVKFIFLSDVDTIRKNVEFIHNIFEDIYAYDICNIDAIEDVTNQQARHVRLGTFREVGAKAFITDVIVHFIHNNEAVEAREIQRRSTDLAFVSKLQNALQRQLLILNDVPHLLSVTDTAVVDEWLLITFVALSIFLAVVCGVLVVVFVIKMRSLKRQLKAFEAPVFSSIASNLNRFAVPNSNIFSVEGSNPMVNKQNVDLKGRKFCEVDTSSEDSEADFADLQSDPTFEMNNMKNYGQKSSTNYEHKILNNDFFTNGNPKSINIAQNPRQELEVKPRY